MSSCKILLMKQLLVRGDEQVVVALFASVEQVPVAKVGPKHLEGRVHRVLDQMTPQGSRGAWVEQDPQESTASPKHSTSWARTASTFRPSTPGNYSRNWATVAPSLRFSNKADTGTRVPRHTQAPLSLLRVPFNRRALIPIGHPATSYASLSATHFLSPIPPSPSLTLTSAVTHIRLEGQSETW